MANMGQYVGAYRLSVGNLPSDLTSVNNFINQFLSSVTHLGSIFKIVATLEEKRMTQNILTGQKPEIVVK